MNTEVKPSSRLILTSILSGSLTLIFSIIYLGLSIITLIFRFGCDAVTQDINQSEIFINILYRIYVLDSECASSVPFEGITTDYSVFVLTTLTLTGAVITLIAAVVLVAAVTSSTEVKYLYIIIYVYLGVCVCSLIVDLTFASHFGIDFTFLTDTLNEMNDDFAGSYMTDMLRLGALLLMSICLKAYVGHLVNIVLLVLLTIYVVEYAQELNKSEHSIHKLGAVKAYEFIQDDIQDGYLSRYIKDRYLNHYSYRNSLKNEMCNHHCELCQRSRNGRAGSQTNYGYSNNEETPRSRSPALNSNPRPEYSNSNPIYDRTNSWQPAAGSARPFSYLEDVKRPPPLTLPQPMPSPSPSDGQWRRDRDRWQAGPPVPAPDYSPHGPRRLKSALKSYM